MKNRLLFSNKALSTNRKCDKLVTADDISNTPQGYYKYGTLLPATIMGSKSYMKREWLQLLAIVHAKGPGDLFVTLTANDSWDVFRVFSNNMKKAHQFYTQLMSVNISSRDLKPFMMSCKVKNLCLVKLNIGGTKWKAKIEEPSTSI